MEIATRLSRSPHQVVLRYLNQRNINAIPKSSNPKNLKANMQVSVGVVMVAVVAFPSYVSEAFSQNLELWLG